MKLCARLFDTVTLGFWLVLELPAIVRAAAWGAPPPRKR